MGLADCFTKFDPEAGNNQGTAFCHQCATQDAVVEDEVSEGICLDSKDEPRQNRGREIQQPKWVYLWAK